MVRKTTRPAPRQPGASDSTERSDDDAIAAGQRGGAHKVSKHPDPATLPKSKVAGDPERPAEAPVNAKREMKYDEAMKLLGEGKLVRSVLTERGWVVVPKNAPPGPKV